MLILSNCLTEKVDEGCLKVANSLVKRILRKEPDTTVVTYDRKPSFESIHLSLNKLLLSKDLFDIIKKKKEHVLYIPFPAKEWATALRIFILSRVCRKRLTVLFTMLCKCGFMGRMLFRLSGADIITLSRDTEEIYKNMIAPKKVKYLKTGVDTERFTPVSDIKKRELRKKYGVDPEKAVVLHVGHLKQGRNVSELMKLDDRYQIILVVSTLTCDEQHEDLREKLLQRGNIKIIDEYLPNVEEIYQLSDVYFFPVISTGNCIDIPLSCMEAASCNKPVVTTDYGEMASFKDKVGFWFIDSFDAMRLEQLISFALETKSVCTRKHVLEYDWRNGVDYLIKLK